METYELTPELFWHRMIGLWKLSCSASWQDVPGASYTFPTLSLKSVISPRMLVLKNGKLYLEMTVFALNVFITDGLTGHCFLVFQVNKAEKYIFKNKILYEFKLLIPIAIQDYRGFNLTSWTLHLYFMIPTLRNLIHSDTNMIIHSLYHIML